MIFRGWMRGTYIPRGAVDQGVGEDHPPTLKSDALMVVKTECASALIHWTGELMSATRLTAISRIDVLIRLPVPQRGRLPRLARSTVADAEHGARGCAPMSSRRVSVSASAITLDGAHPDKVHAINPAATSSPVQALTQALGPMRKSFTICLVGVVLAAPVASAPARQSIPVEATALVKKVHSAALAKDYTLLRSVMANDFVWSFGDDGSATHAIAAWRKDPTYLKNLARATGRRCIYTADQYIECPRNAGPGYRAGFKHSAKGWRMVYFVAGD